MNQKVTDAQSSGVDPDTIASSGTAPAGVPTSHGLGTVGTVSAASGALAGLAAGAIVGPVAAVVGGLVGSVMGAAAGGILDEQHGRAAVGDSEAPPEDIDAE